MAMTVSDQTDGSPSPSHVKQSIEEGNKSILFFRFDQNVNYLFAIFVSLVFVHYMRLVIENCHFCCFRNDKRIGDEFELNITT